MGAGGRNQPLPTTAWPAPDPCERGLKRKLDLILERDIGVRQAGQQFFQVWRHVLSEIGRDKSGNGWRRRRAGPGPEHRHPQAFPT